MMDHEVCITTMVTLIQTFSAERQYNFEEKAIRKDQWHPISV